MDKTSLIRQGLEEARNMLAELQPDTQPDTKAAMLERVTLLEGRLRRWAFHPPTRLERAATINEVVTLKMDVSRLREARTSGIISRELVTPLRDPKARRTS